jgi:inorganic phosphate transporter, PiT family
MTAILLATIILALAFDFLNGIHDSSNVVATMITSRALSPRLALTLTALADFAGPFLFGVAVATTVGHEVVQASAIDGNVIIAAIVSAIIWNLLTWWLGLPSSSSHSLIGGVVGAALVGAGWGAIALPGLLKILVALFISPVVGFIMGFVALRMILALSCRATPQLNAWLKRGQVVTSLALALSHGSNDSQITMGLITLALVTHGYIDQFVIPHWVIVLCATFIALGTALGGWRLIRTLGGRIYKIRPLDAFTSQFASASVILIASLVGGPVSTTQVVSSSIMGTGAAERANKVRWGVATEMAIAWLLTIPASGLIAAGLYVLAARMLP